MQWEGRIGDGAVSSRRTGSPSVRDRRYCGGMVPAAVYLMHDRP